MCDSPHKTLISYVSSAPYRLLSGSCCFIYFSITLTIPDRHSLREETFVLAQNFSWFRSPMMGMVWNGTSHGGGIVGEAVLTGAWQELGSRYHLQRFTPRDVFPSPGPHLLQDPQPSPKAPSAREQAFKTQTCRGRFRFKQQMLL